MGIPEEVLELENRSVGQHGEPTTFTAYQLVRAAWGEGNRNRELALHLAFLSWYLLCEPPNCTGLDESQLADRDLELAFGEAHDYLAPGASEDPELLYVFGLMAQLFPFLLGDESFWSARAQAYLEQHHRVAPGGVSAEIFAGRGAYGAYFHHWASRKRKQ